MALSVFLMLVTWVETIGVLSLRALETHQNSKVVLIIMGATQGSSQNPLHENLKLPPETQIRRNKQGLPMGDTWKGVERQGGTNACLAERGEKAKWTGTTWQRGTTSK